MLRTNLIVGLAALLMLGGCQQVLMKTPAVVAAGLLDPFENAIPERQVNEAPIFVAAARGVSGHADPQTFYTNERSHEVRVGKATLEIGPGMSWDELVQESRAAKRARNPEVRIIDYQEYGPLWNTIWPPDYSFYRDWDPEDVDREPAAQFVEAIESMLDTSRRRQITIFVHGFNTSFGGNLALSGDFWHYVARHDVMMSFDWPSKHSLFSYQADKANARLAVRQFRCLLEFVAANTSAERINIIAHSAGCTAVVEALQQLSLRYYDLDDAEAQRRTKIGHVVLAAPDMDLDEALSASVDGCGRVTEGIAIYASRKDNALGLSADIFGDVRLGRSIGKLTASEREALIAHDAQWIDVTAAQQLAPSFLGHSYFHQCPWVSSDIMILLELGGTPEERGLVRDDKTGFMVFPRDYESRLPAAIEKLRAEETP